LDVSAGGSIEENEKTGEEIVMKSEFPELEELIDISLNLTSLVENVDGERFSIVEKLLALSSNKIPPQVSASIKEIKICSKRMLPHMVEFESLMQRFETMLKESNSILYNDLK
jgi:hypothetical protein